LNVEKPGFSRLIIIDQPSHRAYTCAQSDTGLIYLRARYMNPTLGIFLARDPWSGDAMRPGSINGWNYTDGNPVNKIDPSGLFANPLAASVGIKAIARLAPAGRPKFKCRVAFWYFKPLSTRSTPGSCRCNFGFLYAPQGRVNENAQSIFEPKPVDRHCHVGFAVSCMFTTTRHYGATAEYPGRNDGTASASK